MSNQKDTKRKRTVRMQVRMTKEDRYLLESIAQERKDSGYRLCSMNDVLLIALHEYRDSRINI